jgi:hypothetical protein
MKKLILAMKRGFKTWGRGGGVCAFYLWLRFSLALCAWCRV